MTALALDFITSVVALGVTLGLVMVTSSSPRGLRLGIAASACVVVASVGASLLALLGQPVTDMPGRDLLASFKVLALSWAMLDVSRIAVRIGTLDPVVAAQAARGLLLSGPALRAVWGAWASSVPVPCWVKGVHGQMLAVNDAYERKYEKSSTDYVGEQDPSVWGCAVADNFGRNDREVALTVHAQVFLEPAPTLADPTRVGRFLKFPVVNGRGQIVGVGGMEIE